MERVIKVGLSIGDSNGIGIEVVLKALEDNRLLSNITPVIYGPGKVISHHKKVLDLNVPYQRIKDASEAHEGKINLVSTSEDEIKVDFGVPTPESGKVAFESLSQATKDLASAKIDVLVTAPINKKNIQAQGFNFPGHTEYLTKYANADDSLMLMVKDKLRIGTVTNHIPLNQVASSLSKDLIIRKLRLMEQSLIKDFGIIKPRIAVMGLNPHAGENGTMGSEESEFIVPSIDAAQKEGILAFGPYASDGLFGSGNFKNFDGILSMYHDQGLTPFKALAAGEGVNFTAGLPIVRTSPDHGTAFEIAGKNEANADSLRNAIYLAFDVAKSRIHHRDISGSPLILTKQN